MRKAAEDWLELLLRQGIERHLLAVHGRSGLIRIDECHAHNLTWMLMLVPAHKEPAHRLAHEHVRWMFASILQRRLKIVRGLFHGVPLGTGIAPAIAGAIIRAHACSLGYLRLNEGPVNLKGARTSFKNYRRAALTIAVQMQLTTAHINQHSGRRWCRLIKSRL